MKKFRNIIISKKDITNFLLSTLLAVSIIAVNALYLSDFNSSFSASSALSSYAPTAEATNFAKLAIILDDFGQNRSGVKEMMSIDRHLTFAVMPFLTFTQADADTAHEKGYEVIIHLPMESYKGKLSWVGPRPILSVMSDTEVQQIVKDAFDNVPHALGANIHMGAKAGEDERIISDVLDVIKAKNVYFVDSRASKHPIAKNIADFKSVLCYDRDIFIDGKNSTKEHIKAQLRKSGDIALKKGKAVAIGHVGVEGGKITADAIAEMLPEFDSKNIKLVFISELGK